MKTVLKRAGYALAGAMTLLFLTVGGLLALSETTLPWPVDDRPTVRLTAASLGPANAS